jgi:hypothetical protein
MLLVPSRVVLWHLASIGGIDEILLWHTLIVLK